MAQQLSDGSPLLLTFSLCHTADDQPVILLYSIISVCGLIEVRERINLWQAQITLWWLQRKALSRKNKLTKVNPECFTTVPCNSQCRGFEIHSPISHNPQSVRTAFLAIHAANTISVFLSLCFIIRGKDCGAHVPFKVIFSFTYWHQLQLRVLHMQVWIR